MIVFFVAPRTLTAYVMMLLDVSFCYLIPGSVMSVSEETI